MKTKPYISNVITIILLVLWIPVLVHQLVNFDAFRAGLLRQPFSDTWGHVLAYALPALELLVVLLLVLNTQKNLRHSEEQRDVRIWRFCVATSYLLSALLLTAFTAYIVTALAGMWGKLPCGCGSVIKGMNWWQHLWFNLFFLVLSAAGVILHLTMGKDAMHCVSTEKNTQATPKLQRE